MADTPDAIKAEAGTDAGRQSVQDNDARLFARLPGEKFDLCPALRRAGRTVVYDRRPGDPLYRPLRIYTLNPAESRWAGNLAVVAVPYEPLDPGPAGAMFQVADRRVGPTGQVTTYPALDLDDARVLIRDGREASATDPQFHQQMAYAVCCTVHAAFRKALGRQLTWGFDRGGNEPVRLVVRPHAREEENASYDKAAGELQFGYYRARDGGGRNLKDRFVFTCLSHDIVTHEVTHALLDGLRPHFSYPSGPDALALHEALGDLVALFQRFTFESVVRAAMAESRGRLDTGSLLVQIARQFGETTCKHGPLRSAVRPPGTAGSTYDPSLPPHELGAVLVSAVFAAFVAVYGRKSHEYVRLATGGTGVLGEGDLSPLLLDFLSREASKVAGHFLNICIRAIDYCPPANVTFGDYLRALVTADRDLVPDDPWGYREALIDAFAARQIVPLDVPTLTEDALVWREPTLRLSPVTELSFEHLEFSGDPGRPVAARELARQARVIGRLVTHPRLAEEFGILFDGDPRLNPGDTLDRPCVQSVRSSRRVGPDGEMLFDLIAEVTQTRVLFAGGAPGVTMMGGATVVIGPDGVIRYVVRKHVGSADAAGRLRKYAAGDGLRFWDPDPHDPGRLVGTPNVFAIVHAASDRHRRAVTGEPRPKETR